MTWFGVLLFILYTIISIIFIGIIWNMFRRHDGIPRVRLSRKHRYAPLEKKTEKRYENDRQGSPDTVCIRSLSVQQCKEIISRSNERVMQGTHQYPPQEGVFLFSCCIFVESACHESCFCQKAGCLGVWTLRPDLDFDTFLYCFANLWARGSELMSDQVNNPTYQATGRWRNGTLLLREIKKRWSNWDNGGNSLPQLISSIKRCYFCDDAFTLIKPFVETIEAIKGLVGDNTGIYTSKVISQLFYDIAVPFDTNSRRAQRRCNYTPENYGGGRMQKEARDLMLKYNLSIDDFRRLDDAPSRHWLRNKMPNPNRGTACSRVLDKLFYGHDQ